MSWGNGVIFENDGQLQNLIPVAQSPGFSF